MKTKILLWGLLLSSICGCNNANNTQTGAGLGGLVGAGVGALAAGPKHALAGALIGGGIGAVGGAAIGNAEDRRDDRMKANAIAAANAQAARQMSLDEIAQLSQRGTPDDIIIQQIASTGSIYPNFSTNDLTYLQDQRVSSRVISYIQTRRGVVMVQPRPVVVYERPYYPPPPPPVGVGVIIR